MVLCLHIGGASDIVKLAPEAPVDHQIVVPTQLTMLTAQDLLFGPTLRRFPELGWLSRRAASGGSPSTSSASTDISRTRRGSTTTSAGKLPSEVFREHFLAASSPTRPD